MDFGGPYPGGHYNLVVIDKRTRYPEVERLYSTAITSTKEKLKKIFATYGTPVQLETDNGPPFSSREFSEFAAEEGFRHHRVTPLHPRANGEADSFMKLVNKTEQRAHAQRTSIKDAMQDMLTGYRSTPHPATGITPYEGMMNRNIRTKLDYHNGKSARTNFDDFGVNEQDKRYKQRAKENAENKNTKEHNYKINDYVLLKQPKTNKWSTEYEPVFYIIYKINGSSISARRVTDGREICRDSSFFKLVDAATRQSEHRSRATNNGDFEDRRESVLRRSRVHNANHGDDNIVLREQDNTPVETDVPQLDQPVAPLEDQKS